MLDKYIMIKENKILCGQSSNGMWYCKELPADTEDELDKRIGKVNMILNKYNHDKVKKDKMDKQIIKGVKGLE